MAHFVSAVFAAKLPCAIDPECPWSYDFDVHLTEGETEERVVLCNLFSTSDEVKALSDAFREHCEEVHT